MRALEECQHSRISRSLCEILQEAERPEESVDLLVVEDYPAQGLQLFVLALRFELAGVLGEVSQDHARLGELFPSVHQYRHFAHFVDVVAVLWLALRALSKKSIQTGSQSAPIRLSISAAR